MVSESTRRGTVSHIVAAIFAVALAVATTIGTIPWWVAALYAVASVVSYLAYAADKSAAQKRQWRVSESTLLGLGLVGGWPGSIIAQQRLRHKTQKLAFRRAFAVTVVLNVVVLVVVCTPLRDPVLASVRLFMSTISA
ncbi:Integral membrane protein [Leifsonia rubra CMS 76R]|nr:Integral membrane protein [Leifsonia rubra CMS 76R]